MAWILILLFGALIAVHMARPAVEDRYISSARFFRHLPPATRARPRLRLGNPLFSRIFYLRLIMAAMAGAALISFILEISAGTAEQIGVWMLIDTSASMSTNEDGPTRMDLAKQEMAGVLDGIQEAKDDYELRLKLSGFDLERRDLVETGDTEVVKTALNRLEHRALGTDLGLVRRLVEQSDTPDESESQITLVVVATDRPAPQWAMNREHVKLVWRHIGTVRSNVGFTRIRASRNPFDGRVHDIRISVSAFGRAPGPTRLTVTAPDGSQALAADVTFNKGNAWHGAFVPVQRGVHHLAVSPGGAYGFDDAARIEISEGRRIRVDWQLEDSDLPETFGWEIDQTLPWLRVTSLPVSGDRTPTLVVGTGYESSNEHVGIQWFEDSSPLISDLNFDAVEPLGLPGLDLPEGFMPVLTGMGGRVWIARRDDPPAVLIPGLPEASDTTRGRLSATVFYNAVRLLLLDRPLPPLFTLTSPARPHPSGTRLALHPDEGNTAALPVSLGQLHPIRPRRSTSGKEPVWPILVMASILVFSLERVLASYGSSRWR